MLLCNAELQELALDPFEVGIKGNYTGLYITAAKTNDKCYVQILRMHGVVCTYVVCCSLFQGIA